VALLHALGHATKLQARDVADHLSSSVVGIDHAAQKAAGKVFSNGARSALAMSSKRAAFRDPCTHSLSDRSTLVVRKDQGVLEVDDPAFAVFHPALVEDLEEISCTSGWAFSTSSSSTTL